MKDAVRVSLKMTQKCIIDFDMTLLGYLKDSITLVILQQNTRQHHILFPVTVSGLKIQQWRCHIHSTFI